MDRKVNMLSIEEIRKIVASGKQIRVARAVVARGSGLQITFTYKARRRREMLKISITKQNIEFASKTISAIQREIEVTGTFDYQKYFPNGKNGHNYGVFNSNKLIKDLLEEWLQRMKINLAKSTFDGYTKSTNNIIIPEFGDCAVGDLTVRMLQTWVNNRTSSVKRTRNVLISLKAVTKEAYNAGEIPTNPFSRLVIKAYRGQQKVDPNKDDADENIEDSNADPFTMNEIRLILKKSKNEPQFSNFLTVAFFTGMRTSEMIGLQWKHIDFDSRLIKVRLAFVNGEFKKPKSKSGTRNIKMLPPVYSALQDQKKFSFEDDNEVFRNPRHNKMWKNDKPIREQYWRPLLRDINIRYRRPYQTRHSYASMMLSAGENILWVAEQMGHKDWSMIARVYGRWINGTDNGSGDKAMSTWDGNNN